MVVVVVAVAAAVAVKVLAPHLQANDDVLSGR